MSFIELAKELFPINRSLTGDGVRQTLDIIGKIIPIRVLKYRTGETVGDWVIPREWRVRQAYLEDPSGRRFAIFSENNLHLVGYSHPIDCYLDLEELQDHLHSIPSQPDAIPYITAYYKKSWGFCISHKQRMSLPLGRYRVFIDAELFPGELNIGECVVPGDDEREVLLSTYICHPSMANNEVSGPVVASKIGEWLREKPRKFTYRIVFLPETIGAIAYLDSNLENLKDSVFAGFNLSCLGDERCFSMVQSRYGNTVADRVARRVLGSLRESGEKVAIYSFLERQSDERQYCSPAVDLPLVTLSRSRFGKFPEYHTSLDDFDLVTESGLEGGFRFVRDCLSDLEDKPRYINRFVGEPMLGKRNLYPNVGRKHEGAQPGSDLKLKGISVRAALDVLAYSDGTNTVDDIAELINRPETEVVDVTKRLVEENLIADF